MPIYDYRGVQYDIETADPEEAKRKILAHIGPDRGAVDYAKDFGKATASMADTGLNMITGAFLDAPAQALATAYYGTVGGMGKQAAADRAQQETTSPKDVFGTAFGITQDPAYRGEASRRAMGAVGEGVQAVAKPISTATGMPQASVENMIGSGMLLVGARAQPYINRAGQAVGQAMYAAEPYVTGALKAPVQAPVQFGRGVVEGLINKQYNPATSSMVPLRDTYTPPAAAQRFMGELPGVPRQTLSQLESQARPTSELIGSRTGQLAQAMSPKTVTGETLVPLQGQGMQAFGERVGRGVRTNPLQALAEVGLTALTYIPFKTLAQGVGELGARYLGNKTGFAPGFTNQVGAAQAQAALQPTQPRLTYTPPVAGPVAPQTIYAGAGGASSDLAAAGRAALNEKYPPMPAATPKEMVQQAAAERITPPTTDLQARAQAAFGSQYRPPAAQQTPPPVNVAPVAPESMPAPVVQTPVNVAPVVPESMPAPVVQTPVASITTPGPIAPAAMPKPIATPPAPVVQSTMTPTEKRITFNDLAKDKKGAKEFGIVHDIKNKTRTQPGNSPDTMPSDMRGVLPNNVKWEKSVEHWNPDGSDVAFTEYYTAKTTKNSPVYKYVEPETGDSVLYKQGTGDNWTKVDSIEFPVPKGVLKATEGRAAVQAALDSGKQATIKYKTSAGIITENVNQSIKFKPDPDLALTHRIDRPDHSNTLFGTEKSSGRPVKVEIKDLSAVENNPEYVKVFDNSNPKSPVLIKTYDLNGTLTSTPSSSKKAPPGITNMMTEEQLKVFNTLKRSESTANLLRQLKESGDPNAKSLAELLEKQGYNNKNK